MKIEIEIPGDRIMQLWWSAIEGGDPVTVAAKGGWCNGIELTRASFPIGAISAGEVPVKDAWYSKPDFFSEGVELTITVIEVDDETTGHETKHTIKPADVVRGPGIMAAKYPTRFAQIVSDDIDGPAADIFLQSILFGVEKYA